MIFFCYQICQNIGILPKRHNKTPFFDIFGVDGFDLDMFFTYKERQNDKMLKSWRFLSRQVFLFGTFHFDNFG